MQRAPLLVIALWLPPALAAQSQATFGPRTKPAVVRTEPARVGESAGARDRFGRPIYVRAPLVSMDSAVSIAEAKYQGWHVDAKQISREYHRPIYIFNMITGGEVGTRQLWVDGDTGEIMNPEVMGDTVTVYHRRPPWPTKPTNP
jgi:hypothetical protein